MNWAGYAILSAVFGALVAIFGKIGVRDVDSNLAVALRTVIIVFFAWGIVFAQGNARDLMRISRHSYLFLFLSAVATGLSGCGPGHRGRSRRSAGQIVPPPGSRPPHRARIPILGRNRI